MFRNVHLILFPLHFRHSNPALAREKPLDLLLWRFLNDTVDNDSDGYLELGEREKHGMGGGNRGSVYRQCRSWSGILDSFTSVLAIIGSGVQDMIVQRNWKEEQAFWQHLSSLEYRLPHFTAVRSTPSFWSGSSSPSSRGRGLFHGVHKYILDNLTMLRSKVK